jgi:hypothetical protein
VGEGGIIDEVLWPDGLPRGHLRRGGRVHLHPHARGSRRSGGSGGRRAHMVAGAGGRRRRRCRRAATAVGPSLPLAESRKHGEAILRVAV